MILELRNYTEKSVVVFGTNGGNNVKDYHDILIEAGGKFNHFNYDEKSNIKVSGYVFPKGINGEKLNTLNQLITNVNEGIIKPSSKLILKAESNKQSYDNPREVSVKSFMMLMARVDRLDQEIGLLSQILNAAGQY